MKVKNHFFYIVSVIYSILSWWGFVYISGIYSEGGWGAVGWLVFLGPPIFGLLILITSIASIILSFTNVRFVAIPIKSTYFLFLLQVLLYLLNTSLIGHKYSNQFGQLYFVLLFAYCVTLIRILYLTYRKTR